jgi:DNA invertase Pin-like site-specific DNA recombinase
VVVFDVYLRVSRLGERSEEEATEVYEAKCRAWADRAGVAIDVVEEDTDVSGSTPVAERRLERLIRRVEAGESEGILTPYLDRFGRDVIEGSLAYRRIRLAGGRLVCTEDGIDSERPGDEMVFQLRTVIAEDYLRRVKANFQSGVDRAVRNGVYLASRPPFGYKRKDAVAPEHDQDGVLVKDGSLVVDERQRALVVELFERRAGGANAGELTRFLQAEGVAITKSGVRSILRNRAYVGEMRVQNGHQGEPTVLKGHHTPLLSEQQWEAAQVRQAFYPRTGASAQALLRGLVYCATCERRCKISFYGPPENRKPTYTCTYANCTAHAGMLASKLDGYVDGLLWQAILDHDRHVEAVILGDMRYTDALLAVDQARRDFEEFRDSIELQRELGISGFAQGLKIRKQALELARQQLAKVRRPAPSNTSKQLMSLHEYLHTQERERYRQYIDKVLLKPAGRVGSRVPPVEKRVQVYFAGAPTPAQPATQTETVQRHQAHLQRERQRLAQTPTPEPAAVAQQATL